MCLDLAAIRKLEKVRALDDAAMANEFRTHLVKPSESVASVETLMHAFVDKPCIVHTHPSAILALTNREDGKEVAQSALGKTAAVLPHVNAGLDLGRAVAAAVKKNKGLRAVVVSHHGLITWGAGPKQAYDAAIEAVSQAEEYLKKSRVSHHCTGRRIRRGNGAEEVRETGTRAARPFVARIGQPGLAARVHDAFPAYQRRRAGASLQ